MDPGRTGNWCVNKMMTIVMVIPRGTPGAAKKAGSAGKAVMGSSGKGTKTMNLPASGKGKMSAGFAKGGSCKMARGGGVEARGKTRGKFV